jgi:hypothetical protein
VEGCLHFFPSSPPTYPAEREPGGGNHGKFSPHGVPHS